MSNKSIVRCENIYKSFGPTKALVKVDLQVCEGEIRGLIGENGSGKSTLSSIIAGVRKADKGTMYFRDKVYAPNTMVEAQKKGISMVVQEMGTISGITVASNIFAGRLDIFTRGGLFFPNAMNKAAKQILDEIGLTDINPSTMIDHLNFEDRKIVEIARAMQIKPELLIIDETTTALAAKGRKILYNVIDEMHKQNKAVLFISHDLDELKSICTHITVLRDGKIINTMDEKDMNIPDMRRYMVGRELSDNYYRSDYDGSYDEKVVLELKHITNDNQIENFNLQLHQGEILGIGGLADSGMHEVGRLAFGIEPTLTGEVMCTRSHSKISNPSDAIKQNIGYVSKERDKEALILNASIIDNIVLPSLDRLKNKLNLIFKKSENDMAQHQKEIMEIKCRDTKQFVNELSGGNKQKVVFSRWLANKSDILILDCPTRGIDVGVKANMYHLMYELKKQGKSILLISEELQELIGMSDRILIMKDGNITQEFMRSEDLTENKIIEYMI